MKNLLARHFKKHSRLYFHVTTNLLLGILLTILALYIGMLGYHVFENMSWVDSFLNASMILSGMGPAANLQTPQGKIFAGAYALFSGLAFIGIVMIIISPIVYKFFKKIHLEIKDDRH